MLTQLQKKAAQAIVNILETGRVRGDYGQVTLLSGDSGHLTYGRSQTTLASGNLYLLINAYCETPNALLSSEFQPYLNRLADRDFSLDHHMAFRRLLQEAGDDSIMWEVQDHFFDRVYWTPSVKAANKLGIKAALGTGVVYDSRIHGSWNRIRKRTNARVGSVKESGERKWIREYIKERRNWLATHSNTLLHRTVYRMDSFQDLIRQNKWGLKLPFHVRGIRIDKDILVNDTPLRVSAHDNEERILRRQRPLMRGENVKAIQKALRKAGFLVIADGVFGAETEKALRKFQNHQDLKVDGIVGPATRSALGL